MSEKKFQSGYYQDIIGLPRPVSKNHPPMTMMNRAAQFAPFAALTGYEDAISEEGRLTNQKIELDENRRELLDKELKQLSLRLKNRSTLSREERLLPLEVLEAQYPELLEAYPEVKVTYFCPDEKKDGGFYTTKCGRVKKLDELQRALFFVDGSNVLVENIVDLEMIYVSTK